MAVYESAATGEGSLPVELVAFSGVADGPTVRLAWATASETNNAGFVVEHRQHDAWADASPQIAGHGTTERHAYTFEMLGLAPGTHVFRLRQIDTDGTVAYSAAVAVERRAEEAFALVGPMPNPARNATTVAFDLAEAGPARVELFNLLGRRLLTGFDGFAPAGRTNVRFGLEALPAGTYLVHAQSGSTRATQRLVRGN